MQEQPVTTVVYQGHVPGHFNSCGVTRQLCAELLRVPGSPINTGERLHDKKTGSLDPQVETFPERLRLELGCKLVDQTGRTTDHICGCVLPVGVLTFLRPLPQDQRIRAWDRAVRVERWAVPVEVSRSLEFHSQYC
eukprot:5475138-Amphidinium_carterae.3